MKTLKFLLLFFWSLNALAQYHKGTVELATGESLTGMLEILDENDGINFKTTAKNAPQLITPDKIKAFSRAINNETERYLYFAVRSPLRNNDETIKPRLFKIVSEGNLSFYEHTLSDAISLIAMSEFTFLYVKRLQEPLPAKFAMKAVGINVNQQYQGIAFKKFAEDYFADCQALVEKISKGKLKAKHYVEIAEFYTTQCK